MNPSEKWHRGGGMCSTVSVFVMDSRVQFRILKPLFTGVINVKTLLVILQIKEEL